jgi:hypothetical protein
MYPGWDGRGDDSAQLGVSNSILFASMLMQRPYRPPSVSDASGRRTRFGVRTSRPHALGPYAPALTV